MFRVTSFIMLFFFASCVANIGTNNNNEELLTEEEVMAVISKFDEGWKNKEEAIQQHIRDITDQATQLQNEIEIERRTR